MVRSAACHSHGSEDGSLGSLFPKPCLAQNLIEIDITDYVNTYFLDVLLLGCFTYARGCTFDSETRSKDPESLYALSNSSIFLSAKTSKLLIVFSIFAINKYNAVSSK